MQQVRYLRLLLFVYFSVGIDPVSGQINSRAVEEFGLLPPVSIRALSVVNDSTAWFAANRGVWGFTNDAGKSWYCDSIKVGANYPEFRSIAITRNGAVFLLSVGSPAYLFRTTDSGKSWTRVFTDEREGIFFDALVAADDDRLFAIGDPIDGCFQMISSGDRGDSWQYALCTGFPAADSGEACFAASNSNLVVRGKNIWFVTGGTNARVFCSADGGKKFTALETPLRGSTAMTGIFSLDFYDEKNGIIAGGNYDRTDSLATSLAVTTDGGRSWRRVASTRPFFGSCVRFLDKEQVVVTGHDGTFLVNLTTGKTEEFVSSSGGPLRFHTVRISPSGKFFWLAGARGRVARITLE